MEITSGGNPKWPGDFFVRSMGRTCVRKADYKRLDLLQAGDNVMVDRGFDISTIVPDGVTVNMSPFLAGRDQMTAAETEETMSIASVRIHVERAIGRIKTYHILDGTLPDTLSPYSTQSATVCGLLTNFLPPLLLHANP